MAICLDCLRFAAFSVLQSFSSAPECKFSNGIENYFGGRVSKEECIDVCIALSKEHLKQVDGDVLAASRTLQRKFEDDASHCPAARKADVEALQAQFKIKFAELVETAWAKSIAKKFLPIPDLEEEELQIAAAENWSKEFLEGMAYGFELRGVNNDEVLQRRLVQMAQDAFREEIILLLEQKLISVLKKMDLFFLGPSQSDLEFAKQSARCNHPRIEAFITMMYNVCMQAIEMRDKGLIDREKRGKLFLAALEPKKEK